MQVLGRHKRATVNPHGQDRVICAVSGGQSGQLYRQGGEASRITRIPSPYREAVHTAYRPFDVPGADTFASGINDLGEVVGLSYPRPVAETIRVLIIAVRGLRLPHGTESSLTSKLDAAAAEFSDGEIDTACGNVGAFIKAVQAQSGKKIQVASADDLLARAARLKAMIGCRRNQR